MKVDTEWYVFLSGGSCQFQFPQPYSPGKLVRSITDQLCVNHAEQHKLERQTWKHEEACDSLFFSLCFHMFSFICRLSVFAFSRLSVWAFFYFFFYHPFLLNPPLFVSYFRPSSIHLFISFLLFLFLMLDSCLPSPPSLSHLLAHCFFFFFCVAGLR